jgi:hypothetical protein
VGFPAAPAPSGFAAGAASGFGALASAGAFSAGAFSGEPFDFPDAAPLLDFRESVM